MRRIMLLICLLGLPIPAAPAATLHDATGRDVALPEHIARVLPAGPPAATLLAALAPDLMMGWPGMTLSPDHRAWLPAVLAALPVVPRLTGREDVAEQVRALHPDLILDYGDVTPRYTQLAADTQAKLGVPTVLLDGSLTRLPAIFRALGAALGRDVRAEMLAQVAQAVLASVPASGPNPPRVVYARGADGLDVAVPGTGITEVFTLLGWPALAPESRGERAGAFRHATVAEVAALDPDLLIEQSEAARDAVGKPEWQAVRAVREHHVFIAPAAPFGWIEEPPGVNRLVGLAALSDDGGAALGAVLSTVLWGRAPDAGQIATLRAGLVPAP